MNLVAVYNRQPAIRSSGLLRSAKPDRFLGVNGVVAQAIASICMAIASIRHSKQPGASSVDSS